MTTCVSLLLDRDTPTDARLHASVEDAKSYRDTRARRPLTWRLVFGTTWRHYTPGDDGLLLIVAVKE